MIPYQNGGNTRSAMDDSGLIFLLFRVAGVQTPRTVAGLRKAGKPVAPFEVRAGDVVFFSASHSDLARPAVLLNNTTFIEAFPARSVGLGLIKRMRNRTVLDVRRYVTPE
ncbi:MAG: C40 family peptidase [Gammaproteobacteria bacterium]|nr:C40 family peptidase [Gammaproteobacteria bacterium]